MAEPSRTSQPTTDAAVQAWVQRADKTESQELVVSARVPPRQVTVTRSPGDRVTRTSVQSDTHQNQDRQQVLQELQQFLRDQLSLDPVLLAAAGAIAVVARPSDAAQILEHPLVSGVRLNRHLDPRQKSSV